MQPRNVTKFLEGRPTWGKTTRFNATTAIKRAWSWALAEGHVTLNPIVRMKRPKPGKRDQIPDDRDLDLFIRTAKPSFREFLTFISQAGCRSGEARIMERRHVNLADREVRFQIGEDKTSGKTGKPRVIHLNEAAWATLTRLTHLYPTGPLFRNSQGRAWTRYAINCASRKIRERASLDARCVPYAFRHQWATDALAQGRSIAIVVEMMGNSPEIVAKTYSHLSEKKPLLMEIAEGVRPKT